MNEETTTGRAGYLPYAAARPSSSPICGTDDLVSIRKSEAGDALLLSFTDGSTRALPAGYLWRECRSANGIMRRLSGAVALMPADLHILRLAPVGEYAVNIAFSDGHDRGIFPFGFLCELAVHNAEPASILE